MDNDLREKLTDALALLNVAGVGRGRFRKLIDRFGSGLAATDASAKELAEIHGVSSALASEIKKSFDLKQAAQMVARIEKLGCEVLFTDHPEYPRSLLRIDDYPPLLYRLGQPTLPHEKMIAIVGTRRCSDSSRSFTHRLAAELAESGLVVVSGMAEGIDAAAHEGTLDAGGKTVAVWGTSLDNVYPPRHRDLARRIAKNGTIYSELLPGTIVDRAFFPQRNRIISGMSEGVIVVEAGEKSGALITAEQALGQGRELFAVPGSPGVSRAVGTNNLIKAGAACLTSAADVFEALPRLKGQGAATKLRELPQMSEMEQKMVDHLADGPLQLDQLSRMTSLPVSDLMGYLLALEIKGVIQEVSGKRFLLSDSFSTSSTT